MNETGHPTRRAQLFSRLRGGWRHTHPVRLWLRDRSLACVFILALVACAVILAVQGQRITGTDPTPCRPSEYAAAEASDSLRGASGRDRASAASSVALEVADVQETQISLGRSIEPARTSITLKTDPLPPTVSVRDPVGLHVQSFRHGTGGDVSQAVLAWGMFTSRQTVEIYLCIERYGVISDTRYAFDLEPGQFIGAVTTLDPHLPVTTIPFTVNIAYPDPFVPAIPVTGVVLVGALYMMVLRRSEADADTSFGLRDLHLFLSTPSGAAGTVAGLVAVLGVYSTTCLASDVWGSWNDLIVLIGATFTAFVSAATAFRFASNLDSSRRTSSNPLSPAEPNGKIGTSG